MASHGSNDGERGEDEGEVLDEDQGPKDDDGNYDYGERGNHRREMNAIAKIASMPASSQIPGELSIAFTKKLKGSLVNSIEKVDGAHLAFVVGCQRLTTSDSFVSGIFEEAEGRTFGLWNGSTDINMNVSTLGIGAKRLTEFLKMKTSGSGFLAKSILNDPRDGVNPNLIKRLFVVCVSSMKFHRWEEAGNYFSVHQVKVGADGQTDTSIGSLLGAIPSEISATLKEASGAGGVPVLLVVERDQPVDKSAVYIRDSYKNYQKRLKEATANMTDIYVCREFVVKMTNSTLRNHVNVESTDGVLMITAAGDALLDTYAASALLQTYPPITLEDAKRNGGVVDHPGSLEGILQRLHEAQACIKSDDAKRETAIDTEFSQGTGEDKRPHLQLVGISYVNEDFNSVSFTILMNFVATLAAGEQQQIKEAIKRLFLSGRMVVFDFTQDIQALEKAGIVNESDMKFIHDLKKDERVVNGCGHVTGSQKGTTPLGMKDVLKVFGKRDMDKAMQKANWGGDINNDMKNYGALDPFIIRYIYNALAANQNQ